jgi:hypothetical protein
MARCGFGSGLLTVIIAIALAGEGGCAGRSTTRVAAKTRTMYIGYVEIEPITLSRLESKLDSLGCYEMAYQGESTSRCRYAEVQVPELNEPGIKIYPRGPIGMGPNAFWVTESKIWASKDLFGLPDPEVFKAAVRTDIESIGNIVEIREASWTITKTADATNIVY